MTIQLTKDTYVAGVLSAAGSQHTLDAQTESYLVHIGAATWVDAAYTQGRFEDAKIEYDSDGVAVGVVGRGNEVVGPVWTTDASGNVTGLVGPDGNVVQVNGGENTVVLWGDSMTYDSEYHTSMAVSGYNFSRTNGVTTVTLTAHGMCTGRACRVTRADGTVAGQTVEDAFSGKFTVTMVDANTFTYPQPGLPDATAVTSNSGVGVKGFIGFPDSLRNRGIFAWANILLGQPFELIENLAVNGWRSDQAEAVIEDVIALNPGWVFSQIPGINDIFGDQSIGGALAYDADHVIGSLEQSLGRLYGAGIKLVLCNLTPPRKDNTSNLDVAKIEVYKVNKWLKDWASRRRNVWLIDAASILMATDTSRPSSNLYFVAGGSNTVNSTVTIKSDSSPFTANHVGYVVERTDTYGRALITGYTSATEVTAKIQRVFSAFPTSAGAAFGSGSWTLQADHIAQTGYNTDTIHYSARGAYAVGSAIYDVLSPIVPPRSPLAVSVSDNVNSHGISISTDASIGWNVWEHAPWESTGGTVTGPSTGTAPRGFVVSAAPASTTVAASVVDSPFGPGKALQLSVESAAGAAATIQASTSSALAFRATPGGSYIAEIPFSMTGDLVAKEFWCEPLFTVDGVGYTLGVMGWNMATDESQAVPNVWSGMLRSQEFTLPSGTLSGATLYFKLKLWNSTSAPVVLTIGNVSVLRTG